MNLLINRYIIVCILFDENDSVLLKMRKLILLTNTFPYGKQETFLENELPWLCQHFDVTIVNHSPTYSSSRKIDESVTVLKSEAPSCHYGRKNKIRYFLLYFFKAIGRKELTDILKHRGNIKSQIVESVLFFARAQAYYEDISSKIDLVNEEVIIYSYWSSIELLGMVLHKRSTQKIITRMHGGDLYNERYTYGRQPFKKQMDGKIDACVFISEFGRNYYLNNFSSKADNKYLYRLGTVDYGISPMQDTEKKITVCSCSNIIKLKRVKMIVQALKLIKDMNIQWIHFGDDSGFGIDGEMNEVLNLAKTLPGNINATFMGRIDNAKVLQFYAENYVTCFITTSSTEGCPVSVMEALSFGIPIVATSVGGIPEMLTGTENILLKEVPEIEEIKNALLRMFTLDKGKENSLRKANRELWKNKFSADENNRKWIEFLKEF